MKKLAVLLCLALMLLPFAALAEGVAVVDGMGREVTFDQVPQTCVSLTPANTETLFALGLGDKVIGVDNQSDYPLEALEITNKVGDYYQPGLESIVTLQPDVVFASTGLHRELIGQLEQLGVKVVCNDPTALSDIPAGIRLIADTMGVSADSIVGEIETRMAEIEAKPDSGKKIYFALTFGDYGNYTAGPGTFIDDILTLAGATNVAGGSSIPWPEYSLEQLILDDPDAVLISTMTSDVDVISSFSSTPSLNVLRCVGEGHVYAVDANIVSRPGPRIVEAIDTINGVISGLK